MKIAGYIRDSLDCDVDDILDPPYQRRLIESWCAENGHRAVRFFSDEGPTASSDLRTRLGLGDALAAVRAGEADAIAVARLDRIAPRVILQEQLLAEIEGMGGRLFSASPEEATELEDPSPERRVIREVIREMPSYRSALRDLWVRQRSRRFPRSGADEEEEEAALARIEQLAEQGVGLRDITLALSAEGFRPKLSRVFNTVGLARIVRRLKPESPGLRDS